MHVGKSPLTNSSHQYGYTDWQIISNGYMKVPWNESPTEVAVEGNMTTHSGNNAIINEESVRKYSI
jgi:hypothetical protein